MPRLLLSLTLLLMLWLGTSDLKAQRTYKPHSVLASGNWYKIAIDTSGIYAIDPSFLQSLGLNPASVDASAIRIFGNGGQMLPENAGAAVVDDLQEIAISVDDGGDGILNGTDKILFFAEGPVTSRYDTPAGRFVVTRNLFSRRSYYYLNVGTPGKRVQTAGGVMGSVLTVTDFDDIFYHELDTFNLLSSGRQWLGEEFSSSPGRALSLNIPLNAAPEMVSGTGSIYIQAAARSFGSPSTFSVSIQNQSHWLEVAPVATGPYDQFARTTEALIPLNLTAGATGMVINFSPGSGNAQGWLDKIIVQTRRKLQYPGRQLAFRDLRSVGIGRSASFQIETNVSGLQVWDVTDRFNTARMDSRLNGTTFSFDASSNEIREYIAFEPAHAFKPIAIGRVANQDLHAEVISDYLLITHPLFKSEAERLASFHTSRGLRTRVVTTEEIYNEFSSGIADPTAIRDFVKMQYDRALGDSAKRPTYLLLFGDGSFDYLGRVNNNTNFVPVYETPNSLDPLSTYTSDDFFGFLNDNEDINGSQLNLLDIGIGRIPAASQAEAKNFVDKIIAYHQPASLGSWRNELSFVADDEDNNLHVEDAESIINGLNPFSRPFNFEKIYLDAFGQQSSSSGATYPQANLLINNRNFQGNLIWNYNGHGGYRRLAEEVVLDQSIINNFNNPNRLPLFITATCDVAPFDNPLISSIGENLILREKTGAIALMTTTRLVFAFSNRIMNQQYVQALLQRKQDGQYPTLGDAGRAAKNQVYQFFGDVINNRKFMLLGDPAMRIAIPQHSVVTSSVNGNTAGSSDTLKALSKYTIAGEVRDHNGQLIGDFNGTVYPSVFEKPHQERTLANDPGSIPTNFSVQKNLIHRGSAKVIAGKFEFSFIVPKDINYQYGNGRISYYADNGNTDANGVNTSIVIGGTGQESHDKEGPDIKAYLNDEKFVNGGIANEKPVLILKLSDSSGINILGNGIGHDLTAILDNDPSKQYVLNNFYQSELGQYQNGLVKFQLPAIEEGMHTLTIKAWDVANNSSEISLEFRILKDENLKLNNVLNYPNPFTTRTNFWFDHNRPGDQLDVQVQVFTVSGRLVKTIRSTIISMGNRSSEVQWDGKDDFGGKLGRGVYIYSLRVRSSDGKSAQVLQKLYLL